MELKINSFYDISLFGGSINGTAYRNVQLVSIMNYDTAKKFESIDALHKQVYKYLPEGTPRDHQKYKYYQFKIGDDLRIFADYWIIPGRIRERNGIDYTLTMTNVTSEDVALVRDQLRLLGIQFTIE